MNILIIEDDNNKRKSIANELKIICEECIVTEARSYQSGISNLVKNHFDLLLLDMSLPIFDISVEEDGFQVDPFSGRNILDEMKRKDIFVPTAVITMFETFGAGEELMTLEELDKELSERFKELYVGIVYYNSSEVNWKVKLKSIIEAANA